jgi:recombination DNA repair RAD52 pathway protein
MTELTKAQIGALMSPLSPSRVQHRGQSGRDLSYLAAYDVKATLIRVFGFGGFSAETIESQVVSLEQTPADAARGAGNWTATAMATVRLTIPTLGAVYSETAASSQVNPQPGEALDFAIKTAESDALKRAATYLGTQFGLGLYDGGSTAELVGILFEPAQAKALADWRAERQEALMSNAEHQVAQAKVARALGGRAGLGTLEPEGGTDGGS